MKAVICPVCMGEGKTRPNWKTETICNGCDGKGWVQIQEDAKPFKIDYRK